MPWLLAAVLFASTVTVPLPNTNTLRFIVAGDAGTGDPHIHDGVVAVAKRTHIDAILLVGDNVYPCGVGSLGDPQWSIVRNNFSDAQVPIYPVLGNHDYGNPMPQDKGTTIHCRPSPEAQVEETGRLKNWIFPARQYVLQSPLADIVMIDSQPVASGWTAPFLGSFTASDEVSWASQALAETKATWRIVAGHHTIFSSGVHGVANRANQQHMRQMLLPLLAQYHVDLYICGHDHDAELIGRLLRPGETMFLISGNGAVSAKMTRRDRTDEPPSLFPSFPAKPLVGFALLEITPKVMRITFYDGAGAVRSPTYVIRKRA